LKLNCDEVLRSFAFHFNLHRYTEASMAGTPAGARDKNLGREQFSRKEGDHVTFLEVFRAFQACGVKRRKVRRWNLKR